jgi:hypothetical protein
MFGMIAAGLSIGSTILGARQSRKASKAASAAAQDRSRIVALENARERRNAIRQYRMARAQNIAGGVAAGGQGALQSSAIQGENVSLGRQLQFNMDFIGRANKLNESATASEVRSNRAAGRGALFGAIANVGGQFAGATGGYETLAGKLGFGKGP